jgi:hypothetical protein
LSAKFPRRERYTDFRCLKNRPMFILTVRWDMRLLWAALTITAKFYILFLLAAMFPTNRGIGFSWDGAASGRF